MSIFISIFVVNKTQRNFTNMTKANACKGKKKSSNRQENIRKFALVALILSPLFPSVSNYDVLELVSDDVMIHAVLRSRTERGICPHCGMPGSVHYGFTKKEVRCLPSGCNSVSLTLLQQCSLSACHVYGDERRCRPLRPADQCLRHDDMQPCDGAVVLCSLQSAVRDGCVRQHGLPSQDTRRQGA